MDKFAPKPAVGPSVILKVSQRFEAAKMMQTSTFIDDIELDSKTSAEVIKKLRSSANFVVHNSTNAGRNRYYFDESLIELAETQIDEKDKKEIRDAESKLASKITQAAKKQKEHLSQLLGRLNEEYEINLTTIDAARRSAFPLSVSLQDRQVQVPLQDWGSGTRNRTEILMSLMEASRTKSAALQENRTTPIVILEEPESFLHPFAQAEFGKILSALSDEFGIQIIATTHSPYMLNHRRPEANVLFQRRSDKRRILETCVVDTSGENWMAPFAEILGIVPPEFESWRAIIGSQSDAAILVEGEVDEKYFKFFRDNYPNIYTIPKHVEIVSYGGVDAIRNAAMLRFVKRKFKRMFVTFDQDAEEAVTKSLLSIGMKPREDFCAIGKKDPGAQCIEGLLPDAILRKVYAQEIQLVQALQSPKQDERKSAKNSLKSKLLEEVIASKPNEADLGEFKKLFSIFSKAIK